MIKVKVKKLTSNAVVPSYMSTGAAGCDVNACLEFSLWVQPGERVAVPTGLSVEIPEGYEIQVRPRSGLAFKKGLTVVNAPGTIDSDYRGEIKVLIINLGKEAVEIVPQDRIAQLVIQKAEQIDWQEVDGLGDTIRGIGGFGSTGVSTTLA
jgi:dUTP pyrophosphatase